MKWGKTTGEKHEEPRLATGPGKDRRQQRLLWQDQAPAGI